MDTSQVLISDLVPGRILRGASFAVVDYTPRDAKGFRFLDVTLSDRSGQVRAIYPNHTEADVDRLGSATVVQVWGKVDSRPKYSGQVEIESFGVCDDYDESDYVAPLPANHRDAVDRCLALRNTVHVPYFHLLERVLTDVLARYTVACAAKTMHHAYRGGLLLHSVEVAEICSAACLIMPALNRDLLVAAALLHDVAKIDEIEHGIRRGRYTRHGEMVGHLVGGAAYVWRVADDLGVDPGVRDELVHLLLSHHGDPAKGAACFPATAEAEVLAHADDMSAKVNAYAQGTGPGRWGRR